MCLIDNGNQRHIEESTLARQAEQIAPDSVRYHLSGIVLKGQKLKANTQNPVSRIS